MCIEIVSNGREDAFRNAIHSNRFKVECGSNHRQKVVYYIVNHKRSDDDKGATLKVFVIVEEIK